MNTLSAFQELLERGLLLVGKVGSLLVDPFIDLSDVDLNQTGVAPIVEYHPLQIGNQRKRTEPGPVTIVNDSLPVDAELGRVLLSASEAFKRSGGAWRGPARRPRCAPFP